ncbi:metal-sensing transcriptional repressor [Desulfoluna sp.]|uniref:metal-sensing transcriptional repressor n=1 Tax=Desulfoluna sp. TaxID=2045199 RepID=UPI0026161FF8|nr:metal-sensing transcriptional repressor [Desulfoluna sp.]
MSEKGKHQTHDEIAKRLRRAGGHLNKVVAMIEGDASCVDVARQLHAVYKAVLNAKQALVRDHIEHCLDEHAIRERSASEIRSELAEITKYL